MALRKLWLNVNGVDRIMVCDNDKDTLADVLRRIGLTSVKLGCRVGQCGACSVIYNGKIVRACTRRMKKVNDYDTVETLEGIGTAKNLHPLQKAWIVYGGVQCGFCTPGFIMAAKALLDENPAPTREEVRDFFQKNHNLCRCTGYKPLVDAVMAAAEVMRGEKPESELEFKIPFSGSLISSKQPKPTALGKVLGVADYGDDIALKMPPETLHLAFVFPEYPHANIISIDTSEAEKMPGVEKVVTAKDVQGSNVACFPLGHPRALISGFDHPVINDKKVYMIGDVLAVVCARTEAEAREAAKFVKVELEELPDYHTYLDAVTPGAMNIHEESPNIYVYGPLFKGEDTREIFDNAPHVVEASTYATREPHLPIEPDTCQAYWDADGYMCVHCKSQFPHGSAAMVAGAIGLTPDKVRIIQNPTGGSFGYSMSAGNMAIAAICAMATNKPVTFTMNYREHTITTGKRAAFFNNGRLACDENGKIIGMELDFGEDHGAYTENALGPMTRSLAFAGFPYNIPNIMGLCRVGFSNMCFGTAYRGFGSPQGYTESATLIDMMAEEMGMDPWDFSYLNIARPGDLNNNSTSYKIYPMEEMMNIIKPYYDKAKEKVKAESTPEKALGIGFVCGGYTSGMNGDTCSVTLELRPDGGVTQYNGWSDIGQGADYGALIHTYEALRPLGIKPEQIRLVMNDTAITPPHGPAAGSRSHLMNGRATQAAAEQLLAAMRTEDRGYLTYDEMVEKGIPTRYTGTYNATGGGPNISPDDGHGDPTREFMYLCGYAVVEIDTKTYKTKVKEVTCVSDVGVPTSILSVEGQFYGGLSHCIGYALSEQCDDMKKHVTPLGAGLPQIEVIPDNFNIIHHITYRQDGPWGAGGCSENFQNVEHMMVINAIHNALGVRIFELPATPEKIKEAVEAKERGEDMNPYPYYLGEDFYDTMDYIKANPTNKDAEFIG